MTGTHRHAGDTLPGCPWPGDVQLTLPENVVSAGEVRVALSWSAPVTEASLLMRLSDSHGSTVWSKNIKAGEAVVDVHVPPTLRPGTYDLELSYEGWILAHDRLDILESAELGGFSLWKEAISLREKAARSGSWEDTLRLDSAASEAYERAGADHLAVTALLDVVAIALHNEALPEAKRAMSRATNLAAKTGNTSILANTFLRLGEVEAKLDRRERAIEALDRARMFSEIANLDWVAVKSSILLWRTIPHGDQATRNKHYRILMPTLAYAVSPAAQREALDCVRSIPTMRILETIAPTVWPATNRWKASCDFRSPLLAKYAEISGISRLVVPWDSLTEALSSALLKRMITSFAKFLTGTYAIDVVLAVEASRDDQLDAYRVTLGTDETPGRIHLATEAWSRGDDFMFLEELSRSVGGSMQASPNTTALLELTLPNRV